MKRGLAYLQFLATFPQAVRDHADLVVQALGTGPQSVAELLPAMPCPEHLGSALSFLQWQEVIEVERTADCVLVYRLAQGLLPAPAVPQEPLVLPEHLVLKRIPELPMLQRLSLTEVGHA